MTRVLDAAFFTTATRPEQYPGDPRPEVAFVGRSNVGKSSMINTLAGRKKLVRVSNTPGRTRTLNFFDITLETRGVKKIIRLCDLPGYGFAKAPKGEREAWTEMIETYLQKRWPLRAVVTIVDAEIGPTADDAAMIDFLQDGQAKILVAATKIDRLGVAKRKPQLDKIAKTLELPREAVVGFSATDRIGVTEVWGLLLSAIEKEKA